MAYSPKVEKINDRGCVRVTTGARFIWPRAFVGRKINFEICPVANGIQISRGGRRGGIRSVVKARGGITMCTAAGPRSKCVRGQDFVASPGGGSKLKRGGIAVLNGYRGSRR